VKNASQRPKRSKSPQPLFRGHFINSDKQGGTEVSRGGRDIVTGETCAPVSLNTSLGMQLFCFFLFCGQGCAYLGLQVKAIKLHLTVLTSSSHRQLFIIRSPHHVIVFTEYLGFSTTFTSA
jgi:hypothetical protein